MSPIFDPLSLKETRITPSCWPEPRGHSSLARNICHVRSDVLTQPRILSGQTLCTFSAVDFLLQHPRVIQMGLFPNPTQTIRKKVQNIFCLNSAQGLCGLFSDSNQAGTTAHNEKPHHKGVDALRVNRHPTNLPHAAGFCLKQFFLKSYDTNEVGKCPTKPVLGIVRQFWLIYGNFCGKNTQPQKKHGHIDASGKCLDQTCPRGNNRSGSRIAIWESRGKKPCKSKTD